MIIVLEISATAASDGITVLLYVLYVQLPVVATQKPTNEAWATNHVT